MAEVLTLDAAGVARDARRVKDLAVEAMSGQNLCCKGCVGALIRWTVGSSGAGGVIRVISDICSDDGNGRANSRKEDGA